MDSYIKYLNEDGTRNEGSEMMVAMLALGAETEIRKLKERERRTKAANAIKGIWNGGPTVKYGYSVDSENRYVVNETEAQVVRLSFDLYANSRMGQRQLKKELESRGYILTEDRIRKILSDVGYTGEPYTTKIWSKTEGKYLPGRTVQYPAIVSKEAFLAAQEKREKANTNVYRGTKYFFASGLIRCAECGHAYCGYDYDNLYMCLAHRHANHDIPQCDNNVTVNLTALDSLLWYVASAKHFRWLYENSETQKENLLKEMEIIGQKIAKEQQTIDSVEERLGDIAEMVVDRMMTKEKGKIKAAKVREEAQEAEGKIASYRQRQTAINALLDNSSKDIDNAALIEALDGILAVDQLKRALKILADTATAIGNAHTSFTKGCKNETRNLIERAKENIRRICHQPANWAYWEKDINENLISATMSLELAMTGNTAPLANLVDLAISNDSPELMDMVSTLFHKHIHLLGVPSDKQSDVNGLKLKFETARLYSDPQYFQPQTEKQDAAPSPAEQPQTLTLHNSAPTENEEDSDIPF